MPDTFIDVPAFTRDDVHVESRDVAYKGYFRIDRFTLTHPLFDGGRSESLCREVFERGAVGAVLPYDPVCDRVVLIEQFRPGPFAKGDDCWLLESVAGVLEEGESPEELARREAHEEAGCEITELVPVYRFYTSPGACTETVDMFCGRVDSSGIGGTHGLADEGEDIRVHVMMREAAMNLLASGRIVNAKTIIALQWLALNHMTLRQRWS
ncbi:MAG: nucleoside diphosphate pyrophosphatase [marine bacterium B5-7]|nr:MAG: nucleoside diphosphate pyrophosphatase [marine bacterium B5-7]